MNNYPRSIIPIILMSVMACAKTATDTEIRIEGQQAGDCTDRADNDADGAFDCDDSGCANSPDCQDDAADASDASEMGESSDGDDPEESTCGDGILQDGETCDDGNSLSEPCAYGESACTICNEKCQLRAGIPQYCGDGVVQSNYESCDEDLLVDYDCPYGERECTFCNADCELKPGNVSFCGDGIIDGTQNETCDDGNAEREECDVPEEGCLICNENCEQETVAPTVCTEEQVGDFCFEGVANVPEWPEEVWGLESVDEVTEYPPGAHFKVNVMAPNLTLISYRPDNRPTSTKLLTRESGGWNLAWDSPSLDANTDSAFLPLLDSNELVITDTAGGGGETLRYNTDSFDLSPLIVPERYPGIYDLELWSTPCGRIFGLFESHLVPEGESIILGELVGDSWSTDFEIEPFRVSPCGWCNDVARLPSGEILGTYQGEGNMQHVFSLCDVSSPHESVMLTSHPTHLKISPFGNAFVVSQYLGQLMIAERHDADWHVSVVSSVNPGDNIHWLALAFTPAGEPVVSFANTIGEIPNATWSEDYITQIGYFIRDISGAWEKTILEEWPTGSQVEGTDHVYRSPAIESETDAAGNTHFVLNTADGKLRYIKTRFE